MKRFVITAAVLALTSSVAMADKPNNNGTGGQVVKSVNGYLKTTDTNLGQFKKDLEIKGIGGIVSSINQATNHDDD